MKDDLIPENTEKNSSKKDIPTENATQEYDSAEKNSIKHISQKHNASKEILTEDNPAKDISWEHDFSEENPTENPHHPLNSEDGNTEESFSSEETKKDEEEKPKEKFNWKQEVLSWLEVLVLASAIAFTLNKFIIANSRVPSSSMENTIMTHDRVIGSRLSYHFSDPKRGDIVIFYFPDDITEKTYYVKRIIGMPGDTIDIRDGHVYINESDTPLEEPYIKEPMLTPEPLHYEVPEGCYFMLGDNRNSSADSRFWINSYVKKEKIVAKVLFRYFPSIGTIK